MISVYKIDLQTEKTRYFDVFVSPVGELYIEFSGDALSGISFAKPNLRHGKIPESFLKQLAGYFDGSLREFDQKTVFLEGTGFERAVWNALLDVPYGETRSYKWLAARIGKPRASRAVGRALSKNPIPIVFPCHRIIESDGNLGGYSSGTDVKRRLLALEYYHSQSAER